MPQKKTGRQGTYLKLYKTSIFRQNSKNKKRQHKVNKRLCKLGPRRLAILI